MVLFSVIESVFFISLAITFILILLLVYHFKQRILSLEEKSESMLSIINSLVKEYGILRNVVQANAFILQSNTMPIHHPPSSDERKIEISEDEEDEESEDEEEEEEEDNSNLDEKNYDEQEYNEVKTVILQNTNVDASIETESIHLEEENEEEAEDEEQTEEGGQLIEDIQLVETIVPESILVQKMEVVSEPTQREIYEKMSTAALKSLVMSKKLATDATKMRRPALLELLLS